MSGDLTVAGESVVNVASSDALFTSSVRVTDASINVGGDGFNEFNDPVSIVTGGLRLNYDAALDAAGDGLWSNATTGPDVQFGENAAPTAVNDATVPGIDAAYQIADVGPADGLNNYFEGGTPQLSRADGTFEVVFHVADADAGSGQVLFEAGAARGVSLTLSDATLNLHVEGGGNTLALLRAFDLRLASGDRRD